MSDRSAAVLLDAVLCASAAEANALITEQLLGDPPLVLWSICQSWQLDRLRPESVEQVGNWLLGRAVRVLQWDSDSIAFIAPGPQEADAFADLVAARLEVADMAALISAPDGLAAAEEAFLLGLMNEPREWFGKAAGGGLLEVDPLLPGWLEEARDTAAGRRVLEAVEILVDDSPAKAADLDPQGCRRRAREGRRLWLEELCGPGDRLPALMARLARLEALEERFDAMLEAEKLDAMAEFAAGAGHEINNPLAIIGGRAQLLLKDEADPERRRELALIVAQVKRAHEMIADVRLFARPPQPEPETFDLAQLVDSVVNDYTPQVAEQASVLRRVGQTGPIEIEADPVQLNVALRALCRNALEAIGHDGRIEVALACPEEGEVAIRVSDDGPGIPPDQRRLLFNPFYSSRQAGRGLGTGLSKCWRIVTAHRGRIEVESEPGNGAAFTIRLPLRQKPA